MSTTAIANYIEFLKTLSETSPDSIKKHEKWLIRLQTELKKSILDVERGSEITQAIYAISYKRKIAYNGGTVDTGEDLRFRLGQAAKYYVTWAYTENIIPRNFYPKNPFPKPHLRDAYYLTPEKIWFLYNYPNFDLRTKSIIKFLIDTGVRVNELCKVKLADIDFEKRTVLIFMSKVRRSKTVPLMHETVVTLQTMLEQREVKSEYLFCSEKHQSPKQNGKPLTTHAVRFKLRYWGQKLGFRINPHSFRHGIATLWYKKFGLVPTAKLLGHIDYKYTAHYAHLLGQDLLTMQADVYAKEPKPIEPSLN